MKHIKKAKFYPVQLTVRCLAEQKDNVWQAFCLDLNLAVQGDSMHQVRTKLNNQIREYINDALVGEDRAYAVQLLRRRAPLSIWAKYYKIKILTRLWLMRDDFHQFFCVPMPLTPARV